MAIHPLNHFIYCPRCGKQSWENHGERAKQCTQCELIYYHNVASAVACLVHDHSGNYLFVRRANEPAKGTLDLPGGFVEPNETVEQAVCRELLEETGLIAQSVIYLTSLPNIYSYSEVDIHTSDLFFLVEVDSFDSAQAQDDASELIITRLENLSVEDFGLSSIRQFIISLVTQPDRFRSLYA